MPKVPRTWLTQDKVEVLGLMYGPEYETHGNLVLLGRLKALLAGHMVSSLGSLGPAWPPEKLPDLFAGIWITGEWVLRSP